VTTGVRARKEAGRRRSSLDSSRGPPLPSSPSLYPRIAEASMWCSTRTGLLAGLAWACPLSGTALSSVSIDHAQVGCIVAAGYPQIEARFDPSAEVARARLYFRASSTPHWYYVEMAPQAAGWRGTVPKPRPDPQRMDYYIEVTDRSFGLAPPA